MPTMRDTYRYYFKKGEKIIYAGITNDIDRREYEHQSEPRLSKGYIRQVGFRTTRADALEWERDQAKHGKRISKA